jgi:hypothetical protein
VGIGAVTSSSRTFVEPERTPATRTELRDAIGRAWTRETGRKPSAGLVETLAAHASLETGSGAQMYNFNFGGIKGAGPHGETARCRTKEVVNGREIEIRDGFRAYRTLDEGAVDYVKTMRAQFGSALARAEAGDVDGFAHALKEKHYYTADEGAYASALRRLSGAGESNIVEAAKPKIATLSELPDTAQIERVMDALSHHRTTIESDPDDD